MIDIDIIGQLVPNVSTMIVQLLSTLVLFLVIKKYLWKSVMKFLDARAQKMQEGLDESEKLKDEAAGDRKQAAMQLESASGTSQKIIDTAHREAEDERSEILTAAKTQASDILARAREQAKAEREQMQSSVQKEIVEVAMDAAGKLIGQKSDAETDRRAVEAFVKEAQSNVK